MALKEYATNHFAGGLAAGPRYTTNFYQSPTSPRPAPASFTELDARYYTESDQSLVMTKEQMQVEYPLGFWLNERDDCREKLQVIRRRARVSPTSTDLVQEEQRMCCISAALANHGFRDDMEYQGPYIVQSLVETIRTPTYLPVSPMMIPDDDNLNIDPELRPPKPLPVHPPRRLGQRRKSHLPDQYSLDWESWLLP